MREVVMMIVMMVTMRTRRSRNLRGGWLLGRSGRLILRKRLQRDAARGAEPVLAAVLGAAHRADNAAAYNALGG